MDGEKEASVLVLSNKQDRETVAMALYRAGYTVRERRRREPQTGKPVIILEYWK